MPLEVVAVCEIKINGRFMVQVSNFRRSVKRNATVHTGPYGAYATSTGPESVEGSFEVTISKKGYEFDWNRELNGQGSIVARGLSATFREAYESVTVNSDELTSAISDGRTSATIGWVALRRVPL
jgi:hypothetical protein